MISLSLISLIYSVSKIDTGIGNYSRRLIKGLEELGQKLEKIPVVKREYTVMGKPLLGNLSLLIGTKVKGVRGDIVHSLSPEVIHSRTNIVTVHDLIPLKMKEIYSDTYYRNKGNEIVFGRLNKVGRFITFTNSGKKDLMDISGIEENRIHVVPQAIDHQDFYHDPDVSLQTDGKKLIVTAGDLNPRKRYDLLFEAIGGNDNYQIIHVGPTNAWESRKADLEKISSKFPNIQMMGKVTLEQLRKYFSSADLIVHLSMGEGFGYTPVEAMACGTNVLVNDLDVFRETLQDKAFFTSLEPSEISEQVEYAISHKKTETELIEYSKNYTISAMANKTLEVYKEINA